MTAASGVAAKADTTMAGEADAADLNAKAPVGLGRRALWLGMANASDYAMQFLLPVVLTRCLDAETFGHYRLLWLAVGTVMVLAPLQMPASLYYFLPRSGAATKRLYVHQTMLFLGVTGLAGAWAVSGWNPLLPATMGFFTDHGPLVPVFTLLWVTASLLDLLPTVEERVTWQVTVTISMSLLRAVVIAAAAWITGDLGVLIQLLVVLVGLKLIVLLCYVARSHGLRGPWIERDAMLGQLRQTAPFGVSSALFGLRGQIDQWVAAALFAPAKFAAFAIGVVIGPILNLFRQSVNHAFLPSMSRLQAAGDLAGMMQLNSRANVMVAVLMYPLLAFAFCFADELITLVYTAAYIDAAQVMRVCIVGFIVYVVEVGSIMVLLREGSFAMRLQLGILLISAGVSWYAATRFGLAGAAAGSSLAFTLDRTMTLRRIARRTGITLSRLQDWRTLWLLFLAAVLSGGTAWFVVHKYMESAGTPVQLLGGGALLVAIYAPIIAVTGLARDWPGSTARN